MYLNNNQFKHELCNSSIVIKIHDQEGVDETKNFHINKMFFILNSILIKRTLQNA